MQAVSAVAKYRPDAILKATQLVSTERKLVDFVAFGFVNGCLFPHLVPCIVSLARCLHTYVAFCAKILFP